MRDRESLTTENDSIRDIFIHNDIKINLGPNKAQAQDNFSEENDVDDNSPELKDVEANDVSDILKKLKWKRLGPINDKNIMQNNG